MQPFLSLFVVLVLGATAPAPAAPEDRPNIVLIVADDLGIDCLGCYGGAYSTPNIDRLRREGVRFRQAFATPLGTPSRAQLLSGQYPFRNGALRNISGIDPGTAALHADIPTIADALRDAGYDTGIFGHWGLARLDIFPDHITDCGFNRHLVWVWRWGDRSEPYARYWDPNLYEDGELRQRDAALYGPDVFNDALVEFISAEEREAPFLAMYSMVLPHQPFVAPSHPDGVDRAAVHTPLEVRRMHQLMVEKLDGYIGTVLDALDKAEIAENTLVIFTADNATDSSVPAHAFGQALMRGEKGKLTDAGCRVPLIVRWPGRIEPGSTTDALTDLSDIFPTFLEAADAPAPDAHVLDGMSLLPSLTAAPDAPQREWVYMQIDRHWVIRDARFSLTRGGKLFEHTSAFVRRPVVDEGDEASTARALLEAGIETLQPEPAYEGQQ